MLRLLQMPFNIIIVVQAVDKTFYSVTETTIVTVLCGAPRLVENRQHLVVRPSIDETRFENDPERFQMG